jgi:hypothetical protein
MTVLVVWILWCSSTLRPVQMYVNVYASEASCKAAARAGQAQTAAATKTFKDLDSALTYACSAAEVQP